MVMAAGCDAQPKENQDLQLVKLNQDGSVAWTEIIDSGKDDEMTDIIQTSDGGYIIAGGYSGCNNSGQLPETPVLTRLSSDGKIQWVREYGLNGLIMEALGPPELIVRVFQTTDGILIISDYGMIQQLDNKGNLQWKRTIPEKQDLQLNIRSTIRTEDGGYLLAGSGTPYYPGDYLEMNASMMLTKLDTSANQSWTRIYDTTNLTGVDSITSLENNRGFVGHAYPLSDVPLVLFDANGTILGYPAMPDDGDARDALYKIQAVPGGFYASTNPGRFKRIVEYHYSSKGNITGSRILFNISHRLSTGIPSDETLMTKDQGYLTINASRAQRLTADGSLVWEKEIIPADIVKKPYNVRVRRIIETNDRGYLVVYGIVRWASC
jgi:hypothetical protein